MKTCANSCAMSGAFPSLSGRAKELIRIQQRLDRMERNLSQLITATDDALAEYAKLQQEMKDDMAQLRHDATQLFT